MAKFINEMDQVCLDANTYFLQVDEVDVEKLAVAQWK